MTWHLQRCDQFNVTCLFQFISSQHISHLMCTCASICLVVHISQICWRGITSENELFCAASWTPGLLAVNCTCWSCLLAGDGACTDFFQGEQSFVHRYSFANLKQSFSVHKSISRMRGTRTWSTNDGISLLWIVNTEFHNIDE